MNLQRLPQRVAMLFALIAFGLVWAIGLMNGVPVHCISLRAIIGAAIFWLVGLAAGKVFFDKVCEAISDDMRRAQEKEDSTSRR